MYKRVMFLLLALLMTALTGCSGKGTGTAPQQLFTEMSGTASAPADGGENGFYDAPASSVNPNVGTSSQTVRDAKLIRRAQLSIQTQNFDEAVQMLDDLSQRLGGYYENAEMSGGDFYEKNTMRFASYTVRVPKEQYSAFLNAIGDVGHVVSRQESQEDVGEAYQDAETRRKTLLIKQERLLSLLEKAEKMEDIITLEGALSEVQYEIEQYSATLQRYDGLVDYATINVDLSEVLEITEAKVQTLDLGTRIADAFEEGLSGFGMRMGNLVVWCAYHMVGLLIFAAVVATSAVCMWRGLRRRKIEQLTQRPKTSEPEQEETKQ